MCSRPVSGDADTKPAQETLPLPMPRKISRAPASLMGMVAGCGRDAWGLQVTVLRETGMLPPMRHLGNKVREKNECMDHLAQLNFK